MSTAASASLGISMGVKAMIKRQRYQGCRDADRRAAYRQHKAFRHQLHDQLPRSGAQGDTDRNLFLARQRTRQQQSRRR